jgi:hypothetical protein
MPPLAIKRRVVLGPEPLSERTAASGMQTGNGDGPIVAITLRRDGSASTQGHGLTTEREAYYTFARGPLLRNMCDRQGKNGGTLLL